MKFIKLKHMVLLVMEIVSLIDSNFMKIQRLEWRKQVMKECLTTKEEKLSRNKLETHNLISMIISKIFISLMLKILIKIGTK